MQHSMAKFRWKSLSSSFTGSLRAKGAASVFFSVVLADTKVHLDGCLLFVRVRGSVVATSSLPVPGPGSAAA